MHDAKLSVAPLPHQSFEFALALLEAAFEQDPTLAWCLFAENRGFDERRTNYLRSYLRYHHDALMPALGAWRNGDLIAVSYFAPASCAESPDNLAELGHQIASGCGELSLARIDLLRESSASNSPGSNSSWIEFIGVSPMLQGEGIGSTLLNATLAHLREIEPSGTISLETAESRNIPFYIRHGFAITERIERPGLTQYRLSINQPPLLRTGSVMPITETRPCPGAIVVLIERLLPTAGHATSRTTNFARSRSSGW